MRVIGYLRVSTDKQEVDRQRHSILEYAHKHRLNVDQFYEFKISSTKSTVERGIDSLFESMKAGDQIIVSELSRLGRSLGQIIRIIDDLIKAKIRFVSIKENINVEGEKDRHNKLLIGMFGLLAELERDLISERTKEGMAAAKLRGSQFGRQRGLLYKSKLDGREASIKELLAKGVSQASIAKIEDVSESTLRYFVKSRKLRII